MSTWLVAHNDSSCVSYLAAKICLCWGWTKTPGNVLFVGGKACTSRIRGGLLLKEDYVFLLAPSFYFRFFSRVFSTRYLLQVNASEWDYYGAVERLTDNFHRLWTCLTVTPVYIHIHRSSHIVCTMRGAGGVLSWSYNRNHHVYLSLGRHWSMSDCEMCNAYCIRHISQHVGIKMAVPVNRIVFTTNIFDVKFPWDGSDFYFFLQYVAWKGLCIGAARHVTCEVPVYNYHVVYLTFPIVHLWM